MNSFSDSIWDRTGDDKMSRQLFMLCYGFFTLLGLGATAAAASYTMNWLTVDSAHMAHYTGPINLLVLLIGTLVSSLVGVFITTKSDNPVISLFGYALVAIPFGLLFGPIVAQYTTVSVLKVLTITFLLVGVLTIIGAVIPESLGNWQGWLLIGLVALLLGQFAIPVLGWLVPGFPLQGALALWDWVGIALFGALVVYDVNRARRVPATLDNAVDCAMGLYLDIVNIVLRLLQLLAQRK